MSQAVPLVSVKNLEVRYGSFVAVNGLTCNIEPGCTGLLGPNGAGKTTFLRAMLGLVNPSGGEGDVCGFKMGSQNMNIRQSIGFMPEQDCHIPGMSAVGMVAYAGELAGMPGQEAIRRAHEVLEYSGLGEARYRNVETYSTGMKQRLKIAQAMIHGPKLLLLDEPTNGLDPKGREEMLDLIIDMTRNKGLNVLISSHLLPDIEKVCSSVVVMMRGQLVAQGLLKDLKKIEGEPLDVEIRDNSVAFVKSVLEAGGEIFPYNQTTFRVMFKGVQQENVRRILEIARSTQTKIRGVKLAERSLEEAFLQAVTQS